MGHAWVSQNEVKGSSKDHCLVSQMVSITLCYMSEGYMPDFDMLTPEDQLERTCIHPDAAAANQLLGQALGHCHNCALHGRPS